MLEVDVVTDVVVLVAVDTLVGRLRQEHAEARAVLLLDVTTAAAKAAICGGFLRIAWRGVAIGTFVVLQSGPTLFKTSLV